MAFLENIPIHFDLFVSVPETISVNEQEVQAQFRTLANVMSVEIRRTPNRGRDIAPMLCTFGNTDNCIPHNTHITF